jgi:hypothetical protein
MVVRLKEMWPPSSTDCNPSDYFMWCVVEREVTKCPHITLAFLKVMTTDLMTDLDRKVIIHACKKFWSWIEAVMEAIGVFINYICILYAFKLSLKVSSKCIHPNYYFYCFECVPRVCPNLSSTPCIISMFFCKNFPQAISLIKIFQYLQMHVI